MTRPKLDRVDVYRMMEDTWVAFAMWLDINGVSREDGIRIATDLGNELVNTAEDRPGEDA